MQQPSAACVWLDLSRADQHVPCSSPLLSRDAGRHARHAKLQNLGQLKLQVRGTQMCVSLPAAVGCLLHPLGRWTGQVVAGCL